MTTTEKLQKVLARAGLGSRREMETWISAGRVVVNKKAAKLGDRVDIDNDEIVVDNRKLHLKSTAKQLPQVLCYHKPEGEVCSRSDPEGRPTIFQKLPRIRHGRWVGVGRLDINTSGLMLLTDSGELANQLMHPSNEIEREYAVRVLGDVDGLMLENLLKGVDLEDGPARFKRITDAGGPGANHWYHVILTEGRQREVRRLWESQGVKVSRLMRIRYGIVNLPAGLKQGKHELLEPSGVKALMASVKQKKRPHAKP
ncbi:MAG: 23S rRNA pseudouridine(2605) synthase RluB [Pseudomonadota bacterium]